LIALKRQLCVRRKSNISTFDLHRVAQTPPKPSQESTAMKLKTLLAAGVVTATVAALAVPAVAHNFKPSQRDARYYGMTDARMPNFAQYDTDGDGKISAEELAAGRAQMAAEMDLDGDGAISADELKAHTEKMAVERTKTRLEALDTDGDGVVSTSEMAAASRVRGAVRVPAENPLFARIDTNGDDVISAEELDAAESLMQGRTNNTRMSNQRSRPSMQDPRSNWQQFRRN